MHPERGATGWDASCPSWRRRFNSRTREGCDVSTLWERAVYRTVSIHAPGRGATWSIATTLTLWHVSIHAPGRGATQGGRRQPTHLPRFNSRTREGCDAYAQVLAPRSRRFNSRTREGCDAAPTTPAFHYTRFNSRTREGCDTSFLSSMVCGTGFNSRTREGCDHLEVFAWRGRQWVSIHAPGRGATAVS